MKYDGSMSSFSQYLFVVAALAATSVTAGAQEPIEEAVPAAPLIQPGERAVPAQPGMRAVPAMPLMQPAQTNDASAISADAAAYAGLKAEYD